MCMFLARTLSCTNFIANIAIIGDVSQPVGEESSGSAPLSAPHSSNFQPRGAGMAFLVAVRLRIIFKNATKMTHPDYYTAAVDGFHPSPYILPLLVSGYPDFLGIF